MLASFKFRSELLNFSFLWAKSQIRLYGLALTDNKSVEKNIFEKNFAKEKEQCDLAGNLAPTENQKSGQALKFWFDLRRPV